MPPIKIVQEPFTQEDIGYIEASGFRKPYNFSVEGKPYVVYEWKQKIAFVIYEVQGDILYMFGIILMPCAKTYGKRILHKIIRDTKAKTVAWQDKGVPSCH